ncbi:MAG: sigma-70 family RNA polymerase sigma factor [Pseudonocardia sp.]|uniref:RNA polymerase sigma factor n=1 Tax=unclassified Pseudonocardia TaxID=2619320 RepID=UPI001ACFE005|nr:MULTISPECIES: sigma-70 family RNA polymerase sigma factor [unclassified Pseudonocardia]MBN9108236.1 sigma-70 family RNA polymerase sigma factor [Pseudonocardia sp.]
MSKRMGDTMSTPLLGTGSTTATTEPTDDDLLRRSRAGDPAATTAIVARHGLAVRAAVRAFRLQDADAADAVQNTWVRLLERGGTIRDPQRLRGWLVHTAGRECLALLRRRRRELPTDVGLDEIAALVPGPEAVAIAADVRRVVADVVADLSGRRRQVVDALFYLPGDGYAVLRDCGIPHGSIGPTRGRLLRDLRGAMRTREIDAAVA